MRGLVAEAQDWAWSSARWYLERNPGIVTVSPLPGLSIILEPAIVRDQRACSGADREKLAAEARRESLATYLPQRAL